MIICGLIFQNNVSVSRLAESVHILPIHILPIQVKGVLLPALVTAHLRENASIDPWTGTTFVVSRHNPAFKLGIVFEFRTLFFSSLSRVRRQSGVSAI